jgi:catechol 2,3-dioxygenase-like lactoylglutathione lyase family enzyme
MMRSAAVSGENFHWAPLVPELLVCEIQASLAFWRDLCGFRIAYHRLEEGFAYLDQEGAQVMLEEAGHGRNWITGPMERPLGRGLNFQITLSDIGPMLERLEAASWPLFMAPEEKWYRADTIEIGQRQFLVQDPDGYLIRFAMAIGTRPLA